MTPHKTSIPALLTLLILHIILGRLLLKIHPHITTPLVHHTAAQIERRRKKKKKKRRRVVTSGHLRVQAR